MIEEKSWEDFRSSGMLWWINMILHTFGWAIVTEVSGGKVTRIFPARVKFRGFTEEGNAEGYQKVSAYLEENATALKEEADS